MKNKLTDIQEYLLFFSYSPFLEDFAILTTESNYFKLKIMEGLLTGQDKPMFNNIDSSVPPELL